ncbi:MAG: choice-of-anchor L domain-containing protein [Flavobacteriales bacterium]
MNLKYTSKIFLLCLIAVAGFQHSEAQLTVQYNQTATQMAQSLVGSGVTIANAVLTGADSSYAYYNSAGTEIGTHSGVLLTTGRAGYAVGPNNSIGWCTSPGFNNNGPPCDLFDNNTPGSDLLEQYQQGNCNLAVCTQDACQLEFDITPQGFDLRFEYTFASEEYKEWVGSSFNDVFGFYISGPGITGDQNLALVPVTLEAVAINNVNHLENTQYFYDNQNPYGQQIQYDGFTIGLVAEINGLIPCETYHLTLVIADGVDGTYDSGVFVQAIESTPVVVLTATSNGLDYMVEGCNTGTITFNREIANASPQEVNYWVGGTATNGTDYTPTIGTGVPFEINTIEIPAGETTVSLSIDAIADGLPEGIEYLTIYLDNPACSGNTAIDSVNFYIYDVLEVDISPDEAAVCVGQCIELTGNTIAEQLGTFEWTGGAVSDPQSLVVEVCPTETTTYTLTAQVGACTATDEITVQVSAISVDLTAVNSQCFENGAGSITVTVNDAVEPYSYAWTGPNGFSSTNENIANLEPGEYCVTVTDGAGCIAEACATIIQTNELAITALFSDYTCNPISCYNACDGTIDISMAGGVGPFTFNWIGPDGFVSSNEDLSDLCAGDYSIVVTDDAGCQVEQVYTLLEPDSLLIEVTGTVDLLCTGVETGEASVNAQGGCGPYTFTWQEIPGLTGPVATDLGSGVYNVSVSDVNNCTSDGAVTIVINDPIDPLTVVVDSISVYEGGFNTSCPGSEDGSIDLLVTGGSLPYVFSWFNVDEQVVFSTTEDLVNAPCGEYEVTVTDDNGCIYSQSFILTCVPSIGANYIVTPNPCGAPEAGIGAIEITGFTGGHGNPYTWTWDGPSCPCPSDSTIIGLNSGDYTLNITDTLGCVTSLVINVGQNDVFTASGVVTDLSCYNSCDGMIDVSINPPGSYNYVWSGPFSGQAPTTEDVDNLCAGTYQVTISAEECSETFTFTVNEPEEITVEGVLTNPLCFGQNDGSIDITVLNGSGEYTYSWSAPQGCFFSGSTDEDIFNLFECDYTVEVTDTISDCVVSQTFTLDAPQLISITLVLSEFDGGYNVSCNGLTDACISVFATGGTPDCNTYAPECYLFDWLGAECALINPTDYGNPDFASNLCGLPAGGYGVNVTDANGCLATTCITLTEPEPITSTPVITNIVCADPAGGNIDPGIAGGSGLYFYNWSGDLNGNASNAAILIGVPAGIFTLIVTDSNGCSETYVFEVTETVPPVCEVTTVTDASCNSVCDGEIIITCTSQFGGPINCFINGEFMGVEQSGQPTTFPGLCAGTYVFDFVDENDCTTTLNVTVNEPEEVVINLSAIVQDEEQIFDLQCTGDNNGQIVADVTGGTPGYTYSWTDQNNLPIGGDVNTITGLIAGQYCLSVLDTQGCTDTLCYEITEPELPLTYTDSLSLYYEDAYNISCFNANDGYIEIEISGGVPPYNLDWTGAGTIDGQLSQSGLGEGHYEVLVTDANSCAFLIEWDLTQPTQIVIDPIDVVQPLCDNACNGTVDVTVTGGEPGYSYDWSGPNNFNSTDEDLSGLCEGDYSLEVTDMMGCSQLTTVSIIDPLPLSATIADQYNCGNGTMDLCALASGGTTPYAYAWSTGETTNCIVVSADGEVCVTVTDANGCSFEVCFTVNVEPVMEITGNITNASCGQCNGAIDVTLTGGLSPFDIVWTGAGVIQDQLDQTDLCEGSYTVTITDANGCIITATYTVDQNNPIDASVQTDNVNCNGDSDGSAAATITGASGNVTITWFDATGLEIGTGSSISELPAGSYTMEWQDEAGCSGTEPFSIGEPSVLSVDITVSVVGDYNVGAPGATSGYILLDVNGGTPSYTYDWSPIDVADTTSNPQNLGAGEYVVTITDANGCTLDTLITLTQPEELELPTGLSPNGDGFNDTYYIPGAYLCDGSQFKVFNRWGNLVYEKDNYDNDWYGQTKDGGVLADGTYFVLFEGCGKEFNTYVDLRRE